MKELAIIILNYNTWEDTLQEIKTLQKIEFIDQCDIIVVDNNSTNDSYDKLSNYSENSYILIKSDQNRGYASGNNIGLRYAHNAGYKYAWILNNDIIIEDKNILKNLIEVLKCDDSLAVVNPDIYAPNGHLYNRDSKRPSFLDLTLGMFKYRKKGREVIDLGGYGYVYRPQGCCMIVDLDKINEVDYFDEATFLYSEEIILAERLMKKNYRCACCLKSSVIHNHSKTVNSSIKRKQIRKIQLFSFNYYLKEYRKFSKLKRFICNLFYKVKLKLI